MKIKFSITRIVLSSIEFLPVDRPEGVRIAAGLAGKADGFVVGIPVGIAGPAGIVVGGLTD